MRRYGKGIGAKLTPDEAEEIAAGLSEEELERGRLETVCVRWAADEARTLSEASGMLRELAAWLADLEAEGWQLVEPIDGGHGHLVNRDPRMRIEEERGRYLWARRGSNTGPQRCQRCALTS